jgi:predicted DNA-binding ArsR family transcriptional regulator
MTTSDLYSQTLSSLTDARTKMLSPAWQAALDTQTPDQRLQASQDLMQTQLAISTLSNAALSDIAAQMAAVEDDLNSATDALDSALADITKVQGVLKAITDVLNLVEKIVPLVH